MYKISLDQKNYARANMELVAKDRMRELSMWSKLKKEFNDGTFDDKNVNTHQLESYQMRLQHKVDTITPGTSQPEVFNLVGQLETIKRVKNNGELNYDHKQELPYNKPKK